MRRNVLLLVAVLAFACGGGNGGNGGGTGQPSESPVPTGIQVTIAPDAVSVAPGEKVQFQATVSGTTIQTVRWSVEEAPDGGQISQTGLYTAPGTTGVFHVVATSAADADARARATVTVSTEEEAAAFAYSTFLGGSQNDRAFDVTHDAQGNAYVVGSTSSPNFPTTLGAYQATAPGAEDGFVAKLNRDGSAIVFATFLGGQGTDRAVRIDLDAQGNIYVAGDSSSADFPTTPGAYQASSDFREGSTPFVAKLSATGSNLVYSTWLNHGANAFGVAVDGGGNACVAGAHLPAPNDSSEVYGFFVKLNATGSALVYDQSSLFAGTPTDAAVDIVQVNAVEADTAGNCYAAGTTNWPGFTVTPGAADATKTGRVLEGFVRKLSPTGGLLFSTFLGGSASTTVYDMALDQNGNVIAAGATSAPDFPTTAGAYRTTIAGIDGFVSRLRADGRALLASTALGGAGQDRLFGVELDPPGNVYVAGLTRSGDFPTTDGALDRTRNAADESEDVVVASLSANLAELRYGTYLGLMARPVFPRITVPPPGTAIVVGATDSQTFPTTPGAATTTLRGGIDAFVMKLTRSGNLR